jgi:uncharacterized membrane protein YraQ (UPF0718 family)
MPKQRFNKEDAEALTTFLFSLKRGSAPPAYMKKLIEPDTPEMRGRRVFEKHNCLGCHKVNRDGGEIGPDLTGQMKRVRPEWLSAFLKKPYRIRPLHVMKASMPDFRIEDEDIKSIVEYLAFVSGVPFPYVREPVNEVYMEDVEDGEKLYHAIFACVSCPIWREKVEKSGLIIRTRQAAINLRNSLIKYGFLSIFMASLVGVLTPLCSCGILTTAMTLLFAGLPLAPVMALLVSSPLISPSAYMLTLNDLGPQWTVIRVIAAFLMGIFAGVLTHLIRDKGFRTDTLLLEGVVPEGDFHDREYPDERLRCNCKEKFGNRVAAGTDNRFIIFWAKSYDMLWLVGKYVLVGVAIGIIVERYMPEEWIYSLFGRDDGLSIVWITIGAIPVFLHQISASSILYHIKSTLDGTLNGGAGLAFLIGGPVTAMPAMMMLWAIFRKRVFFLYMFVSVVGTIVLAYSFQYLVFVPNVDTGNPVLRGVRSVSGGSSSVITKTDRNVSIVMDPHEMAIIALYDNYIDGGGGVVLDAGFDRFRRGSAHRYDNGKYINNIALWLEERGSSPASGNILVYNTFYKSGLDNSFFIGNGELSGGEDGAFQVRITDRKETPQVSDELLQGFSQLWIIFGEASSDCCFSDAEIERINRFTERGGGLLVVAGHHGKERTGANGISSRYGVVFSGSVENREELHVSKLYNLFSRLSESLRRFYSFVT